MCGFSLYFNNDDTNNIEAFNNLQPRGPECSTVVRVKKAFLGFHRLCINGLKEVANQPFVQDGVYLVCNGEIYNHTKLGVRESKSGSDCEAILHLYLQQRAIAHDPHLAAVLTAKRLDGEFAFALYDTKYDVIHLARDPTGVRPLYWSRHEVSLGAASELKGISKVFVDAEQFPAGTVASIDVSNVTSYDTVRSSDVVNKLGVPKITKYYDVCDYTVQYWKSPVGQMEYDKVKQALTNAVRKRLMSERPVCALLSGGLDSSLVAALVAREIAPRKLDTYSIGMAGGTDLKYAKMVADHIGSNHYEIILTEKDFLGALEETIRIVESYDITTVRASVGNYLVAKYIKENSDNKVVFNGDYADEVCGGYLYLQNAPTVFDFHKECCRLVRDIIYFDALRSDRCISSQGLEARVPFSDPEFVDTYLSLDANARRSTHNVIEKNVLRQAFAKDNLLPDAVLWRRKEAFSDAVSSTDRSWFKVIQDHIDTVVSDEEYEKVRVTFHCRYKRLLPYTKESYYYRKVFCRYYEADHVVPYYWLPKWSDNATDPSARTLSVYSEHPSCDNASKVN